MVENKMCALSLRSSQYGMWTRAHTRTRKANQVKKKINKWENGEKLTHTFTKRNFSVLENSICIAFTVEKEIRCLSEWVSECVFFLFTRIICMRLVYFNFITILPLPPLCYVTAGAATILSSNWISRCETSASKTEFAHATPHVWSHAIKYVSKLLCVFVRKCGGWNAVCNVRHQHSLHFNPCTIAHSQAFHSQRVYT